MEPTHFGNGTLGFAPACHSLAETTRMLLIARAVATRGRRVRFFSHGGHFESLVRDADLPLLRVGGCSIWPWAAAADPISCWPSLTT